MKRTRRKLEATLDYTIKGLVLMQQLSTQFWLQRSFTQSHTVIQCFYNTWALWSNMHPLGVTILSKDTPTHPRAPELQRSHSHYLSTLMTSPGKSGSAHLSNWERKSQIRWERMRMENRWKASACPNDSDSATLEWTVIKAMKLSDWDYDFPVPIPKQHSQFRIFSSQLQ